MSRGYGWVQRAILEALPANAAWVDLETLAKAVYDTPRAEPEHFDSARRALSRLERDGLVETRKTVQERKREWEVDRVFWATTARPKKAGSATDEELRERALANARTYPTRVIEVRRR